MFHITGGRLHDFDTYISSDTASPIDSTDKELCGHFAGPVANSSTVRLECIPILEGRYAEEIKLKEIVN